MISAPDSGFRARGRAGKLESAAADEVPATTLALTPCRNCSPLVPAYGFTAVPISRSDSSVKSPVLWPSLKWIE